MEGGGYFLFFFFYPGPQFNEFCCSFSVLMAGGKMVGVADGVTECQFKSPGAFPSLGLGSQVAPSWGCGAQAVEKQRVSKVAMGSRLWSGLGG